MLRRHPTRRPRRTHTTGRHHRQDHGHMSPSLGPRRRRHSSVASTTTLQHRLTRRRRPSLASSRVVILVLLLINGAFVDVVNAKKKKEKKSNSDHDNFREGASSADGGGGDGRTNDDDDDDDGAMREAAGQQSQRRQLQQIQRGVPISDDRVTAKELYRAYAKIKEEYNDKAFGPSNLDKWTVLRESKGGAGAEDEETQIALLHHATDPTCPYVRMHAVMPGSVADVWGSFRLSNWDRLMSRVDPFYEGLTILGQYDYGKVNLILARKRAKRLVTFGKRDFVFVSVSDVPRSDGVLVSGTVSVVTAKHPRVEGYTRAFQDSIGFYEPRPDDPRTGEPRTAVTIVCRIDLNDSGEGGVGGMIPMWLYVQTLGVTGAASMNKMRKQLRLEMEERMEANAGEGGGVKKKGRQNEDDDDDASYFSPLASMLQSLWNGQKTDERVAVDEMCTSQDSSQEDGDDGASSFVTSLVSRLQSVWTRMTRKQ